MKALALWARDIWAGNRRIRVALLGSKSSGKTVLLTAIANHLTNHNAAALDLGGIRVAWNKGAASDGVPAGTGQFDYLGARDSFARGLWPAKTAVPSVLCLPLTLDDSATGKRENVQLEIMDIPGERVSDFAMFGRSYDEWCLWMEGELAGPHGASPAYRKYLAEASRVATFRSPGAKAALFAAYRDFVVDCYAHFSPHVTPSTLKLGLDGTKRGGLPDEFRKEIARAPIGFMDAAGKAREFVPLPAAVLTEGAPVAPLAAEFRSGYDAYRRHVLRPLEDWLGGANKLFYLVDVLSLLQSGPRAWNAERSYGEAAISMLCARKTGTLLDRIRDGLMQLVVKTKIDSACIVATKADMVLGKDRDNMGRLAQELLKNATVSVSSSFSTCAAVRSTHEVEAAVEGKTIRALQGKLAPGEQSARRTWIPSPVPALPPATTEQWKQLQSDGSFNYQPTFPAFGRELDSVPEHLGLNAVIREMLH